MRVLYSEALDLEDCKCLAKQRLVTLESMFEACSLHVRAMFADSFDRVPFFEHKPHLKCVSAVLQSPRKS